MSYPLCTTFAGTAGATHRAALVSAAGEIDADFRDITAGITEIVDLTGNTGGFLAALTIPDDSQGWLFFYEGTLDDDDDFTGVTVANYLSINPAEVEPGTITADVEDIAIPAAPAEATVCRVYGYLETPGNVVAVGVPVKFRLVTSGPSKSNKLIAGRVVNATTDSQGRLADSAGNPYVDMQRTDMLTPLGAKWVVTCEQLGWCEVEFELEADTFDLAELID